MAFGNPSQQEGTATLNLKESSHFKLLISLVQLKENQTGFLMPWISQGVVGVKIFSQVLLWFKNPNSLGILKS